MKAYAIKDQLGDIEYTTISWSEESCKENFVNDYGLELEINDFTQAESLGFECVPVEITEIKK